MEVLLDYIVVSLVALMVSVELISRCILGVI